MNLVAIYTTIYINVVPKIETIEYFIANVIEINLVVSL